MKTNRYLSKLIFILAGMLACNAQAMDLNVSGFGSVSLTQSGEIERNTVLDPTTEPVYYGLVEKKMNYNSGTKLGVNLSSQIDSQFSLMGQLILKQDPKKYEDSFMLEVDLALLNIAVNDNIQIRLGKLRWPLWIVSDYYDANILHPWVRPPMQSYLSIPVNSLVGGSVNYKTDVNESLSWSLEAFGGNSDFDEQFTTSKEGYIKGSGKNIMGLTAQMNYQDFLAKLSFVNADVKFDIYDHALPVYPLPGMNESNIPITSLNLKYDNSNYLAIYEYVQWEAKKDINIGNKTDQYLTLGKYFLDNKFLTHVTYQIRIAEEKPTTVFALPIPPYFIDHDEYLTSLGLNYYYNDDIVVKFDVTKATPKVSSGRIANGAFNTPLVDSMTFYTVNVDFAF